MMQKILGNRRRTNFGMRALSFLLAFLMVISPMTAFAADVDEDYDGTAGSGEMLDPEELPEGDDTAGDTYAPYTVTWFDTYETELASDTREGIVGETVAVEPTDLLALDGYMFLNEDERNVQTGEVAADGSTELKLYFDEVVNTDVTDPEETVDDSEVDVTDPEETVDDSENTEAIYTVEWRNPFGQLIQSETRVAEIGAEVSVTEDDKLFDTTSRYFFNEDADGNILEGTVSENDDLVLIMYFDDVQAAMETASVSNYFYFIIDMRPYGGKLIQTLRTDLYPSPHVDPNHPNSAYPGEMTMYDKFDWAYVDENFDYEFDYYWSDLQESGAYDTDRYYETFWGENKTSQTGCKWYFGYPRTSEGNRHIKWMPTFKRDSVTAKSGFQVNVNIIGDDSGLYAGSKILAVPNETRSYKLSSYFSNDAINALHNYDFDYVFAGYELISGVGTFDSNISDISANFDPDTNCIIQANYVATKRSTDDPSYIRMDIKFVGDVEAIRRGSRSVVINTDDLSTYVDKSVFSTEIYDYTFVNYDVVENNILINDTTENTSFSIENGESVIVRAIYNVTNKNISDATDTIRIDIKVTSETDPSFSEYYCGKSHPITPNTELLISDFIDDSVLDYRYGTYDFVNYSNTTGNGLFIGSLSDPDIKFIPSDGETIIVAHYQISAFGILTLNLHLTGDAVGGYSNDKIVQSTELIFGDIGCPYGETKKLSSILDTSIFNDNVWMYNYYGLSGGTTFSKSGGGFLNITSFSNLVLSLPTKACVDTLDIYFDTAAMSNNKFILRTEITGDQYYYSNSDEIDCYSGDILDLVDFIDFSGFDKTIWYYSFNGYEIKSGNGLLTNPNDLDSTFVKDGNDNVIVVAKYEAVVRDDFDGYILIYDVDPDLYDNLPESLVEISDTNIFTLAPDVTRIGTPITPGYLEGWDVDYGDGSSKIHSGGSELTAKTPITICSPQFWTYTNSKVEIGVYVNVIGDYTINKKCGTFYVATSSHTDPEKYGLPKKVTLHPFVDTSFFDYEHYTYEFTKFTGKSYAVAYSESDFLKAYGQASYGTNTGSYYGSITANFKAVRKPFSDTTVNMGVEITGDESRSIVYDSIVVDKNVPIPIADLYDIPSNAEYTYEFTGYSISEGSLSDEFDINAVYDGSKNLSENISITANFTAVRNIVLKYDTNGGSDIDPTYAENNQFMVTRRVPTKEGFIFKGWAKKADAADIDYIAGDILAGTSDRILYAVWAEDDGSGSTTPGDGSTTPSVPTAKTYTLTYETGTDMEIAPQKSNIGSFTVTRRTPVKEGHTFVGWSLDENPTSAAEVDYFAGDVFPATANVTLYAVFAADKELDTYAMNYDTQGGSEVKATAPEDGHFMVTRQVPVKKGYVFAGWALDADSKGIDYIGGDKVAAIENVTLYAVWVKEAVAQKYMLSYDSQGGSEVLDTEAVDGKFMVTRRTPKKDGKVFLGWSLYPDDDDIDYLAGDFVLADKNVTLYAVYTDAVDAPVTETFTLTYDTRGGSAVAETKSYNGIFTVTRRVPEKEGLVFAGWTLDSDSENPNDVDYAGGDAFPAEADLTLYALYKTADITVNVNGGSDVETNVTIENNQYIIVITIPSKPGYDFPGWDTDGDGEVDVLPDEPIITEDPDQPIDAVWTLKVTPAQYVTTNDSTWLSTVLWDNADTLGTDTVRGLEDALVDDNGRAMVQIPDTVPVRSGYVFLGWELGSPMMARMMALSDAAYYQAGDIVYMDEIDSAYENGLRFTAIWEPEDQGGDSENPDDGKGDTPQNPDDNKGDKPGNTDGDNKGDQPGNSDGDNKGDKPGNSDGDNKGDTPNGEKPGSSDTNKGDKPTGSKPSGNKPNGSSNTMTFKRPGTGSSTLTTGITYRNTGNTVSGGKAPQTGDITSPLAASLMLLSSMAVLIVMLEKRKQLED